MKYFEIIHIKPNKQEIIIAVKHFAEDIPRVTEKYQWRGTWLTPERKLLRHNRGELVIREKVKQPRISSYKVTMIDTSPWYECSVRYGGNLHTIFINGRTIIGYDEIGYVLWSTNSLTELAEKYISKELAYQCQRHQDNFIDQFKSSAG